MAKVKSHELRTKQKKELMKQVDDLKAELGQLRVAQATNGAASKLGKIRLVRKNIARVLTVVNQTAKDKMRAEVKGLKRIPKQLRAKKTRALRRALTKEQKEKVTTKAHKKATNFAVRKFAIVA